MIKISVITVVYNGLYFIENTIKSVLNQTYKNIEYIIIDGDSNDGTKEILTKYSKCQNVLIYSEKDNGIYDAMNKGLKYANGDWVLFLNAGDSFYSNNIIENIFHNKKNNFDNVEIIYGDVNVLYTNFNKVVKAGNINNIWKGMQFSHQSAFIKKIYHLKNLYDINYKVVADFNFFLNAYTENVNFLYTNNIISNTITGGISDKNRLKTFFSTFYIVLKKNKNLNIYLFYFAHFSYILITYISKLFLPKRTINIIIKFLK